MITAVYLWCLFHGLVGLHGFELWALGALAFAMDITLADVGNRSKVDSK